MENRQKEQELLSMDEAIELLNTSRPTFYRWLRSGSIKGQKVGRQWRFYREDLERFVDGKAPKISLRTDINPLKEILLGKINECSNGSSSLDLSAECDVELTCRMMVSLARLKQATDIHLDTLVVDYENHSTSVLRFRIMGQLETVCEIDYRLIQPIVEKWKDWAGCDAHENTHPQTGSISKPSVDANGSLLDMRVHFLPTDLGLSLHATFLNPSITMSKISIENIGLSVVELETYKKYLNSQWGAIFVAGPNGCGKTTTLYCGVKLIASPRKKVITVECPVDERLPWAVQMNVPSGKHGAFAKVLEQASSVDAEAIYVSDLPDPDSVELALKVATNKVGLICVHSEDVFSVLRELRLKCKEPSLINMSARLLIAQRLIRKLCPHCAEACELATKDHRSIASLREMYLLEDADIEGTFKIPVGCDKCANTGFIGRKAYYEMLELTPELNQEVQAGANESNLRRIAYKDGLKPLAQKALELAMDGEVSLVDVFRAFSIEN